MEDEATATDSSPAAGAETASVEAPETEPKTGGGFPKAASKAPRAKKFSRPKAKSTRAVEVTAPSKKKEPRKMGKDTKKAAAKKTKTKERKPRSGGLDDAGVIAVLVDKNPYRDGSNRFKQFAKIRKGMTVAKAVAAGCSRRALARAVRKKQISVK
jgi:hypothetical protein